MMDDLILDPRAAQFAALVSTSPERSKPLKEQGELRKTQDDTVSIVSTSLPGNQPPFDLATAREHGE